MFYRPRRAEIRTGGFSSAILTWLVFSQVSGRRRPSGRCLPGLPLRPMFYRPRRAEIRAGGFSSAILTWLVFSQVSGRRRLLRRLTYNDFILPF